MKAWLLAICAGTFFIAGCGHGDDAALPYEDENDNANEAAEENNADESNDEEAANDNNELTAADDGEELYEQACASCHGGDLEGETAPGLTDASYDETMEYLVEDPNDTHEGLLSEEESEAVAEWIEEY
ncbi:c-type cytochrome [Salisediminibacterium halotolerans]|uniref:Cytochrome c551 n=1 Tax=Salisediminibacterium halotolerans TaxID=517425 RepID=A0A1H9TA11_9BACI|nr:c-type cytochrome [Salisediminibacterium haloalkalitolerans]SER93877.1 cytochrome c551 [Salisediminibacterium haloalkalitolerans]